MELNRKKVTNTKTTTNEMLQCKVSIAILRSTWCQYKFQTYHKSRPPSKRHIFKCENVPITQPTRPYTYTFVIYDNSKPILNKLLISLIYRKSFIITIVKLFLISRHFLYPYISISFTGVICNIKNDSESATISLK